MMADYQRRLRLQELAENEKKDEEELEKPPKKEKHEKSEKQEKSDKVEKVEKVVAVEPEAKASSGEVIITGKQNLKDAFKGDSGSSDDVLTINLNSKADRKREKKKAKKERQANGETIKRKKVSFHIEKNMTRGKLLLPDNQ